MTQWLERLKKEAQDIVYHGKGKLELHVTEREKFVVVSVIAGKRWEFKVEKVID